MAMNRMLGRWAPAAVASLTLYTDSARIGMAALVVFLVVGLAILLKVPYPASSSNQSI